MSAEKTCRRRGVNEDFDAPGYFFLPAGFRWVGEFRAKAAFAAPRKANYVVVTCFGGGGGTDPLRYGVVAYRDADGNAWVRPRLRVES